jgi:hydrogenase maturation protein HypF
MARTSNDARPYSFPLVDSRLDWRPLLRAVVADRVRGRNPADIARAFHAGVARGLAGAAAALCRAHHLHVVAASGGVFQNAVLADELAGLVAAEGLALWTNHVVPPNDGGISLGQAALGALGPCTSSR